MHPLLARRARVAIYLFAWLAFGALSAMALVRPAPALYPQALAFTAPLSLVYGVICLSAWWVCRSAPIGPPPWWKPAAAQLAAAGIAGAFWSFLATLWSRVTQWPGPSGWPATEGLGVADGMPLVATLVLAAGISLYLFSAVAHYLIIATAKSHAAERRTLESQVHLREAELRALRAQLNPHFLFNSLNSINALIGSDPPGARRMCERLGEFLRLTLRLGSRETVTLAEELQLVDHYAAIEVVRFGDRLRLDKSIDPAALSAQLPPLLLQPLMENAVKHGVAGRTGPVTLSLDVRFDGGMVLITLENPVDEGYEAPGGTGTGLDNVRRRLAALGGREARLRVERAPERYTVQLAIPAALSSRPDTPRVMEPWPPSEESHA